MSKRSNEIPPIRRTPGLGEEKANDAAIAWTGGLKGSKQPGVSKTPKGSRASKTAKRKTPQHNIAFKDEAQVRQLMKLWNLNRTALVNMALSKLAQESLK